MAEDAIKSAESLRNQLVSDLTSAKARVRELEQLVTVATSFVAQLRDFERGVVVQSANSGGTSGVGAGLVPGAAGASLAESAPKVKNSRKEEVASGARVLIEEAGRPLSRSEIFASLTRLGYIIDGSEPEMVLSTMLWRAGEAAGVTRLKRGGGYWLLEQDWPDAKYFPSQASSTLSADGEPLYRGEPQRDALLADGFSEDEIDGKGGEDA